ncbi:MAG: NACHT domain-containing protein, partial [Nitrospirota bacterium]|nr:NACHT domain-containing protein [Nitrospirota bacterium]
QPVIDIADVWGLRVPFFVPLRYCSGSQLPQLDQYPKIGTEFPLDPPPGWVQSVIEAGRALILIDGIDEIPKAERSQIRKALEGFCRLDKGNYVVLTTRPGIIDDEWFRDIDVMHAEVNPLSELERGELIEQWHKAAAEQLTLLERPDDASELAPVLIEQLRTAPHVAQLGTNPLLCAAICALHYSKQGYLPKRQADLCHHLCQLLIHQRDLQRSLAETKDTSDYGLLEYDHKESLIRTMAQAILRTGNAAIEREEADALIGEKLPHLGLRKSLDATFVRERLVERTGLLREAYGGAIDFAHNTLRDFLAGQAFANESLGHKELAQHVNEESWQRPIVFAAGAGTRDFAERLVRALLSRGSRMCRILA